MNYTFFVFFNQIVQKAFLKFLGILYNVLAIFYLKLRPVKTKS